MTDYLARLEERRYKEELWDNIIFGLSLGWVLTLSGIFHFYFMLQRPWFWVLLIGLTCLATTVLLPVLIKYPRRIMQFITSKIFAMITQIFACIAYFMVIVPVGIVLQSIHKTNPFYEWVDVCSLPVEGWVDKSELHVNASEATSKPSRIPKLLQAVEAIGYFAKHGELTLVPTLVLVLVVALVGAFIQSTVPAPMIYTLF